MNLERIDTCPSRVSFLPTACAGQTTCLDASLDVVSVNAASLENTSVIPVLKYLIGTQADVLILTNVGDTLFAAVRGHPAFGNHYEPLYAETHAPGGLYILSHFPLLDVSYIEKTKPGQRQVASRGRVLSVTVQPEGADPVTIASASLLATTLASTRRNLAFAFAVLPPGDVLLAGEISADSDVLPSDTSGYTDLWSHPQGPGYTWDPLSNPLATGDAEPSRVDRLLLRSGSWTASPAALVGPDTDFFPLAHYALRTTLRHQSSAVCKGK